MGFLGKIGAFFGSPNDVYCKCDCHKKDEEIDMEHFLNCCSVCPHCKKYIKNEFIRAHSEVCTKKIVK